MVNLDINNVQIITIGKEQYSSDNSNWTNNNSIAVLNDLSPNNTWSNWGASQWDLFFLDHNGNYVEDFNINTWDYNKIYNSIMNIISGCTDSESENYNSNATIDDGSYELAIENLIVPVQYGLTSIYPNPFNPITTVFYSIPEYGYTSITINDLSGRLLKTLTNTKLNSGDYKVNWNASSYPSGVYLIKMEYGVFKQVLKVVLLK